MFLCTSDLILNYAVNETTHDHIIFYSMESYDEIWANRILLAALYKMESHILCFQWDWHIFQKCKALFYLAEAVYCLRILKPNVGSAVSNFNCLC